MKVWFEAFIEAENATDLQLVRWEPSRYSPIVDNDYETFMTAFLMNLLKAGERNVDLRELLSNLLDPRLIDLILEVYNESTLPPSETNVRRD